MDYNMPIDGFDNSIPDPTFTHLYLGKVAYVNTNDDPDTRIIDVKKAMEMMAEQSVAGSINHTLFIGEGFRSQLEDLGFNVEAIVDQHGNELDQRVYNAGEDYDNPTDEYSLNSGDGENNEEDPLTRDIREIWEEEVNRFR